MYQDDSSLGPIVGPPINWSTELTDFLAMVSSAEDERTASRVVV